MLTKSAATHSKLDRAIILSVAAMLGFNVFVLTQQVQFPARTSLTASLTAAPAASSAQT